MSGHEPGLAALAVVVWGAVLAFGPRSLWPGLSARMALAAAAGLAGLGLGALAAPAAGPAQRIELALLVQAAAALALFDLRWLLIPDFYTFALGVAGVLGPLSPGLAAAIGGALLGGGLLAGVRWAAGRWLREEAMGWGDVKLAAALGALLGPLPLLWTIAIAAGLGAIAGLAVGRGRRVRTPLGALLAPVGVAVLWATQA